MEVADGTRKRGPLGYVARGLALVLVGSFIALLFYGVLSQPADTTIDSSLAEAKAPPAPGFELELLRRGTVGRRLDLTFGRAAADGKIGLEELRGVPVVLNFWASWCPPCRVEAPRLQRRWRLTRERGVLFLGLDMQDLPEDAREFIGEFRLSYPNVRDQGDDVARDWGVTGLPETFFISVRGRVVGHVIGAVSQAQLDDGIRAARAGRPLAPSEGGARQSTR
jgi:cytochrome c biogenesis protein CcmG, thiol:disulfide interchange protein DsbE